MIHDLSRDKPKAKHVYSSVCQESDLNEDMQISSKPRAKQIYRSLFFFTLLLLIICFITHFLRIHASSGIVESQSQKDMDALKNLQEEKLRVEKRLQKFDDVESRYATEKERREKLEIRIQELMTQLLAIKGEKTSSDMHLHSILNSSEKFEPQNIVMVKGIKVGGSTLSGVMRHIGAHHGISGFRDDQWIGSEPGVWATHSSYSKLYPKIKSLTMKSFILTMVREPISRCMSDFFFFQTAKESTRRNSNRSPQDFEDKVKYFSKFCTDHSYNYIRGRNGNMGEIIKQYDFIGLTERFNESMVILKHLLGVPWRDVLYIPSKIVGASGTKLHLHKPSYANSSQELKEFVENVWREKNKDFLLYDKAVVEFQKKAKNIPNFQEEVRKYELILDTAQRMCSWVIQNTTRQTELGQAVRLTYLKDAQKAYHCLNQVGDLEQYFIT